VSPVDSSVAGVQDVTGAWQLTEAGYSVSLALAPAFWRDLSFMEEIRFDLAVNEMQPGRQRRAGQLIWSGGGGWVYLRGDRQDAGSLGVLDLA